MITLKLTIESNDDITSSILSFETKQEVEAFAIDPDKVMDFVYELHLDAEKDGIYDEVEDDGDHYNGDTDNDILA